MEDALPVLDVPPNTSSLQPPLLDVLRLTSHLLLQDADPDTQCQAVYAVLRERLGVDVYFHYLLSPDGDCLELASAGGNETLRGMLGSRLEKGQAVCGAVAQCGERMHLQEIQSRSDSMTALIRAAGTESYICHPLTLDGELLGTLSFGSTQRTSFSEEEQELFAVIAQQLAIATDRRRRAAQLREMESLAAAGRMSATLAHEINNPLESLATILYLLRTEVNTELGQELLGTADSQVARLAEVTRHTLSSFRGRPPQAHPIDLSKLARELIRGLALPRDVRLVSHVDEGLRVRAVPAELRQVIFNLLLNAAQFSPPGKEVRLTVCRTGRVAEVRVSDEGPGISVKTSQRIFEPFQTMRARGSTGIGLWLSREILERNGGSLRFVSEPEVRPGTEFIASLPLVLGNNPF